MKTNPTVYIIYSEKLNRFYTGFTTDFDVRFDFHLHAEKHKFTAKADDWELHFKIECASKNQGLKIERHIKDMKSKKYIQNLLLYPEITQKLKERYRDC